MLGRLTRQFIESRIVSALTSGDITTVKKWLVVANNNIDDGSKWDFTFTNGKSIEEFLNQLSDENLQAARQAPKWYQSKKSLAEKLHQSQMLFQLILLINQDRVESAAIPTKLSKRHHLSRWFKNKLEVNFPFVIHEHPNVPLKTKKEIDALSVTEREKYIQDRALNQIHEPRIIIDLPKAGSVKKPAKDDSLTLVYQIDQQQQKQRQQDQSFQLDFDLDLDAEEAQNIYVDNSAQLSFKDVWHKKLKDENGVSLKYPRLYLLGLSEMLEGVKHNGWGYNTGPQLVITEDATAILRKGASTVRAPQESIDLNNLPLGFFVDTDGVGDNRKFILKFSALLRKDQIAKDKNAALRLDPYGYDGKPSKSSDAYASELKKGDHSFVAGDIKIAEDYRIEGNLANLENTLKLRKLTLTAKQRAYLEKLDKKKPEIVIGRFSSQRVLCSSTIKGINAIAKVASQEHLSNFIDLMQNLSKRKYQNFYTGESEYLSDIVNGFLLHLTDGEEFNRKSVIQEFQQLATLSDTELTWFYLLTIRPYIQGSSGSNSRYEGAWDGGTGFIDVEKNYHPNFNEINKGLLHFFEVFRVMGVPLPNTIAQIETSDSFAIIPVKGFIRLKGVLDCIIASRYPQVQARQMAQLPVDTELAKNYIRAGYSVVSVSMHFTRRSAGANDRFHETLMHVYPAYSGVDSAMLTPEDLRNFEFKNVEDNFSRLPTIWFYKAFYLRYLALNTDGEGYEAGLKLWEEKAKQSVPYSSLETEASLLAKNWDELKQFALSLPLKVADRDDSANEVAEAFINEKEKQTARNQKMYSLKDLQKLPLPADLVEQITPQIKKLNELYDVYSQYTGDQMRAAAKNAKEDFKNGKLDLINCLALLRQIHWRHKKQWLRLEQVVNILACTIDERQSRAFQIDTSEGKTLTLQMIALLHALQGRKTNIHTHNETLAKDSFDETRFLASLFQVTSAGKEDGPGTIIDADILFIDTPTAVINQQIAQQQLAMRGSAKSDVRYAGERKAAVSLQDEEDNVVIDIHASTTMQFSLSSGTNEVDESLEKFLFKLNEMVSAKKALDDIKTGLSDDEYFLENPDTLNFWISAASARVKLQRNVNYVVDKEEHAKDPKDVIYIVHDTTTG